MSLPANVPASSSANISAWSRRGPRLLRQSRRPPLELDLDRRDHAHSKLNPAAGGVSVERAWLAAKRCAMDSFTERELPYHVYMYRRFILSLRYIVLAHIVA